MKAILLGTAAFSLMTVAAFGADLPVRPAEPPLPPPQHAFNWSSCYGGLHAGGGFGTESLNDTTGYLDQNYTDFSYASAKTSGYMLGGQIGCDYQFASNLVVGIEGSASGGNITGKSTFGLPGIITPPGDTATFKASTDFMMSVTGRVGYAWDRWMLYAKGGFAGVNDKYSITDAQYTYDFEALKNRIGWTAGAGIEWAFCDDWSVRLEYDYYGLNAQNVMFLDNTISGGSGPESIKQNIQVIKLGLNFHVFGDQ